MSDSPLVPCVHCGRFVRSCESTCHFCARSLAPRASVHRASTEGLSRSAIVALGVALAAAACDGPQPSAQSTTGAATSGTTSGGSGSTTDGTTTPTTDTTASAADAGPATTPTPGDGTMMQTRYGAPPFVSFDV
jgi:hypothetical protein